MTEQNRQLKPPKKSTTTTTPPPHNFKSQKMYFGHIFYEDIFTVNTYSHQVNDRSVLCKQQLPRFLI